MGSLSSIWTQMSPPKPQFTETSLPTLEGKVYIVTGSNTGIGKILAQILYSKHAKVYIAARSEEKSLQAISDIKKEAPDSKGALIFLHLDLSDLTTIKTSAASFLAQESTLHVLFNNAGVMMPPQGSKTAQGYELQLGTNCLGTFMFTKLLTPLLISTAKSAPPNTVRVIWVSSSAAELFAPKGTRVPLDNLDYKVDKSPELKYGVSKAGNYLHAVEYAKRVKGDGVISVALNPGNLRTDLGRHQSAAVKFIIKRITYPAVNGACTELFAGLSPDVTLERSGDWIIPWGRFYSISKDLVDATKTEGEGGTGTGLKFWEWSEEQVKPYL